MQRIEPPRVRPGEIVTARHFEQMGRAIRAGRLLTTDGSGVRLTSTPNGTLVAFSSRADFSHPWRVNLQGANAATVEPGTVNGFPATIDGEPLDGGEENTPPPVLRFSTLKTDADGRGWLALEVTFDPAKEWGIIKAEIVQVADCDTDDGAPAPGLPPPTGGARPLAGNRARHPLAMLRQRDGGRLDVFQHAFFPLKHRPAFATDGKTIVRHFFS